MINRNLCVQLDSGIIYEQHKPGLQRRGSQILRDKVGRYEAPLRKGTQWVLALRIPRIVHPHTQIAEPGDSALHRDGAIQRQNNHLSAD